MIRHLRRSGGPGPGRLATAGVAPRSRPEGEGRHQLAPDRLGGRLAARRPRRGTPRHEREAEATHLAEVGVAGHGVVGGGGVAHLEPHGGAPDLEAQRGVGLGVDHGVRDQLGGSQLGALDVPLVPPATAEHHGDEPARRPGRVRIAGEVEGLVVRLVVHVGVRRSQRAAASVPVLCVTRPERLRTSRVRKHSRRPSGARWHRTRRVRAPRLMDASDLVPLLAVVMAVGALGTVVPLLPGLALIWGAGLVYGLVEGFDAVGAVAFAVMTALAAGATIAGWVVPKRRASGAGAGRSSVWLGMAAAVVGFFVVPVIGLALGGVLGIYVGEHLRTGDPGAAWVTTRATITGFGIAALIQFGAALAMIAVWVVWVVAT